MRVWMSGAFIGAMALVSQLNWCERVQDSGLEVRWPARTVLAFGGHSRTGALCVSGLATCMCCRTCFSCISAALEVPACVLHTMCAEAHNGPDLILLCMSVSASVSAFGGLRGTPNKSACRGNI